MSLETVYHPRFIEDSDHGVLEGTDQNIAIGSYAE